MDFAMGGNMIGFILFSGIVKLMVPKENYRRLEEKKFEVKLNYNIVVYAKWQAHELKGCSIDISLD